MAVRSVLQFGNPVLRRVADEVLDFASGKMKQTLVDLEDTLLDLQQLHGRGGGLAAPQIGSSIRVVFVNAKGRSLHLINPVITTRSTALFEVWDFCFSSKAAFVAPVLRNVGITVEWRDDGGATHCERFEGYFSELLQHEIDHLNGRLFVDLIERSEDITMIEEWNSANATPRGC